MGTVPEKAGQARPEKFSVFPRNGFSTGLSKGDNKMQTIKTKDVHIERHLVNGSWSVSAMVNNRLVRRSYYGFTKKEAITEFKEEVTKCKR